MRTDVSEEHITSIFKVGNHPSKEQARPPAERWILSWLLSTLKMEVIYFSETSVYILTTRCYIPESTMFITTAVTTSNPTKLNLIAYIGIRQCEL
jgi:hypothetical protein